MIASTSFMALGLASIAAALPYGDIPSGTSYAPSGLEVVSYTAKFDDVTNTGLLSDAPTRGVTPLGPYDNLFYNLNAINTDGGVTGVKPQSSPNVISFDTVTVTTEGEASIYSDYDDSITDHFNLKNFYFGCVVINAETVASVPTSCDITITGYRNNEEVASQDANFNVGALSLLATMQKVTLNSRFKNVDKVVFNLGDDLTSTLDAVLIDNVSYDAYLKSGETYSYSS